MTTEQAGHTIKTPLRLEIKRGCATIYYADGKRTPIADHEIGMEDADFFSALVACVNALRSVKKQRDSMLAVLDDLESSFDEQTYEEKKRDDFDSPDDRQFSVNITAKQLREIGAAIAGASE